MKLAISFLVFSLTLPTVAKARTNSELSRYLKLTQTMQNQLVILKDAGKCGNIGSRVADSMDKGLADLQAAKRQVTEALKKGPAGMGQLAAAVQAAEKDFDQIDRHKGMVLWGLDGDEEPCKVASRAFTTLHDVSAEIPNQLRKVSESL